MIELVYKNTASTNPGSFPKKKLPARIGPQIVVGSCPACGENVYKRNRVYACRNQPHTCDFHFPIGKLSRSGKEVIELEEMASLLDGDKIYLDGLRDRKGDFFDCFGYLHRTNANGWCLKFTDS